MTGTPEDPPKAIHIDQEFPDPMRLLIQASILMSGIDAGAFSLEKEDQEKGAALTLEERRETRMVNIIRSAVMQLGVLLSTYCKDVRDQQLEAIVASVKDFTATLEEGMEVPEIGDHYKLTQHLLVCPCETCTSLRLLALQVGKDPECISQFLDGLKTATLDEKKSQVH